MSTQSRSGKRGSNPVVAQEPAIEPEELVSALRLLRQRIPYYGPLTTKATQAMIRVAHLDDDFVNAGINAAGASDRMEKSVGLSAEALRRENADVGRWSAVEDELKAMLTGVAAANLTRKYRIGIAVLQVYSVIRQLVRGGDQSELLPYIDEMKRFNRFGHKRKKAVTTEPEP